MAVEGTFRWLDNSVLTRNSWPSTSGPWRSGFPRSSNRFNCVLKTNNKWIDDECSPLGRGWPFVHECAAAWTLTVWHMICTWQIRQVGTRSCRRPDLWSVKLFDYILTKEVSFVQFWQIWIVPLEKHCIGWFGKPVQRGCPGVATAVLSSIRHVHSATTLENMPHYSRAFIANT
jgi:hypothetical protein